MFDKIWTQLFDFYFVNYFFILFFICNSSLNQGEAKNSIYQGLSLNNNIIKKWSTNKKINISNSMHLYILDVFSYVENIEE